MAFKARLVDQVSIAVEDLKAAEKALKEIWNFKVSPVEEVISEKVRVQFVEVGESRLEFLEATDSNSPIAKFLSKRGQGIHHIAFEVDNLKATLEHLKSKGVELINDEPKIGAGGHQIAFVHPRSFFGVLLELVQK